MSKFSHNLLAYSALTILLVLSSCFDDLSEGLKSIPTAIGKTNEIIVVAENPVWESPVGDTLNFYFGGAYPIMPFPEPIFDLRHFSPKFLFGDLSRQRLRTYLVLVDVHKKSDQTTLMALEDIGSENLRKFKEGDAPFLVKSGRNKWAKNQLVTYILGKGSQGLIAGIKEKFPQIASKINDHDKSQLEAKLFGTGLHAGIAERILERYGIKLKIPKDFQEAIENDDILWLRKETRRASLNVILSKIPYMDKNQLEPNHIMRFQNELTKKYISSETPNSYMTINDEDLPVWSYFTEIDGNYTVELRGIWEMTEDFMGGPFFSWMIHNPVKKELVFIEAFVLSPGEKKRDLMQQLNLLIEQASFPDLQQTN